MYLNSSQIVCRASKRENIGDRNLLLCRRRFFHSFAFSKRGNANSECYAHDAGSAPRKGWGPSRTEVKTVPPLPIYRQPARKPLPGTQCLAGLCETPLPPAISCLYRYDAYIIVRTQSLVQNVPRG